MVIRKANPEFNIYYKDFDLDPAFDYYVRCERLRGKTTWYVYFKWSAIERVMVNRVQAREYLRKAMEIK